MTRIWAYLGGAAAGLFTLLSTTPVAAAPVAMVKTASTKSDPLGNLNPLAVPGAVVEYQVAMTGATTGGAANLEFVDGVPGNMTFCLDNFDLLIAGPVIFTDTSFLLSSGIGFPYTSVGSTTDNLDFSRFASGTDWTYQPGASTGCDTNIRRIRVRFSGTFGTSKTATLRFQMRVN
jgi:hypothetical protein